MPGIKRGIPGDELYKCFGILVEVVGGGARKARLIAVSHGIAVIGKPSPVVGINFCLTSGVHLANLHPGKPKAGLPGTPAGMAWDIVGRSVKIGNREIGSSKGWNLSI